MNEQHGAGSTETHKHSPGPWRPIDEGRGRIYGIRVANTGGAVAGYIAFMSGPWMHADQRAEQEANARLIVAAPDLLALAKKLAGECAECGGVGYQLVDTGMPVDSQVDCADCYDIRAVIAKAEGRS